ncbi:hypothetical protein KCP71_19720 [Salmonella enterica subsp. enterica]|nr:hypothetical protein KCP71_19720 [Salmonella enterica subsp. enterica]
MLRPGTARFYRANAGAGHPGSGRGYITVFTPAGQLAIMCAIAGLVSRHDSLFTMVTRQA